MTKHSAYNSSSCYSGSDKNLWLKTVLQSLLHMQKDLLCGQEMPTPEDQPPIDSQVSYLWSAAFIKAIDSLLFSPASGSP